MDEIAKMLPNLEMVSLHFWMNVPNLNKYYFIYLQHGSSKFMDVNSSITPLKIATYAAYKN
jgi:hypothetical protein